MIQSYTVSHLTRIAVAFEQKLNGAGNPRVGDAIRFEHFRNGNTDKKDYRLAAQLNLPLSLSPRAGSVTFGPVKEYWNQVFTTGEREWALNTKPNATATNPSIEETINHPTKYKGIYSHVPMPAIKNTVYVTLENTKVYIYLMVQLKNETAYVRLEYTSDQQPAPVLGPVTPEPQSITRLESTLPERLQAAIEDAAKTLGLTVELEAINRGEGARSFFGSDALGPQTDSEEVMQLELRKIQQLLALIANSKEIRARITELKVDAIKIINPYASKALLGIFRYETGRAMLVLKLEMTEAQIGDALDTTIEAFSAKKTLRSNKLE